MTARAPTTMAATPTALGAPQPQLLAALAELEQRVHRASRDYDDQPWQAEHFARPLPGKAELSVVATDIGGEPLGFLIASARDGGVHVHRLAVDPTAQRTGLGSLLLATVLAAATGPVTVNCDQGNAPALALYAAAGFRRAGTTAAGKLLLVTDPLPGPADLRIWYVYTATGMQAGHAAHLPGLVRTLAASCQATAVRYGDPDGLPMLRPTLGWVRAFTRTVARARRDRVDVVFVRIHWKLAGLFWLAGRLGGGWRVALWSSGGQGYLPGATVGLRQRAVLSAHRAVLRHAVDAVVTGPPRLLTEYAERYRLAPRGAAPAAVASR